MPRNKGTANRKLARTLAGKKLTPWLLKLTQDRALPLTLRPLLHRAMPPLALSIWQQLGHIREKSSRLAGWITNHATSPQAMRPPSSLSSFIPTLAKPAILQHMWQRPLDLLWFRRYQKRKNRFPQTLNVTDQKTPVPTTDELYPNELPQTPDATHMWKDELHPSALLQSVRTIKEEINDEAYPMVIENWLSSPMARVKLPYITDDSFYPTYNTSIPLVARLVIHEPEAEDSGGRPLPNVNPIAIPSIYPADQIQRPYRQQVKAQANWQPQHTYQSRWSDKAWTPLPQRLALYRVPVNRLRWQCRQYSESFDSAVYREIENNQQKVLMVRPVHWPPCLVDENPPL